MSSENAPQTRRLSVAILARDEESLLPLTLASVQSIADEIVLVDTGSTDGTCRVAREFGARVIDVPWTDDFSSARNRAWPALTGDWVLWIDAGEQLCGESRLALREFIDAAADPSKAYLLLVELPPVDAQGCTEQRGCLRLVPRLPGMRFAGRIRETLDAAADVEGLQTELLPLRLLRTGRDHDPELRRKRARRNLRIAEREQCECGPVARLLLAMADAHAALGVWVLAAQYYRDAIDRAPPDSTDLLEAYYGLLTTLDHHRATPEEPLEVCLEALARFPLDAQLLCAAAGYLHAQGRLDLAARSYEVAWKHGQSDPQSWHVRDINALAASCLALVLQLEGEDERARGVLEAVLAESPKSVAARRQLIDLHIKAGRTAEALLEVDRLPGQVQHRELLRNAVRGACQVAGRNWIPAVAYLQTAYSAGCRDPICLRWLSVALVSTGCQAEALPVVRAWLDVEPGQVEARRYLSELTAVDALRPESVADSPDRVTVTAPIAAEWRMTAIAAAEPVAGFLPSDTHIIEPPAPADMALALGQVAAETQHIQTRMAAQAAAIGVPRDATPEPVDLDAAVAHFRAGRFEQAVEGCRRTIAAGSAPPAAWQYAAHGLVRLRRWDEAEPLLRELLMREPRNALGHELLVQVLTATGRHGEAQVVVDQLRRIEGLFSGPHFPAASPADVVGR